MAGTKKRLFDPAKKLLLFSFQPGDLIFGISKSTKLIIQHLSKLYSFVAVYQLNLHSNLLSNFLHNDIEPHEKLRLDETQQQHLSLLENYRTYINKPGGKSYSRSLITVDDQTTMITRRICKLLLINAVKQKRHIHFELNGINFQTVCMKTKPNGLPDYGITNSELRLAYRLRLGEKNNVFFYKNGSRVKPPWQQKQYKIFFAHYEQQRIRKQLNTNIAVTKLLIRQVMHSIQQLQAHTYSVTRYKINSKGRQTSATTTYLFTPKETSKDIVSGSNSHNRP